MMKTRILTVALLGLILSIAPATAFGQGNGKGNGGGGGGGGKGGGGGESCQIAPGVDIAGTRAVSWDDPELSIGDKLVPLDDSLRLANDIAVVEHPDGYLLVAGSLTTSPAVSEQVHRVIILSFHPTFGWDVVRLINTETLLDPVTQEVFMIGGRGLLLGDLDGDGREDDLLAGGGNVAVFYNVDLPVANPFDPGNDAPPDFERVDTPAGTQGFGRDLAFADVGVDALEGDGTPFSEIVVGAATSNEAFVYDVDCPDYSFPCTFTMRAHLQGDSMFGSAVAVDGNGGLYVSAKWAKVGKKNEAGEVFYSPAVLDDPPSWSVLQRENPQRGEKLGEYLAVTAVTGPEELVAAPEQTGGSLAVFDPLSGLETAMLDTSPDSGFIHSLTAVNGVVVAGATTCGGSIYKLYWDGSREVFGSPDETGGQFGRASYAISSSLGNFIFATERQRDQDGNGIAEGQIYVFDLN